MSTRTGCCGSVMGRLQKCETRHEGGFLGFGGKGSDGDAGAPTRGFVGRKHGLVLDEAQPAYLGDVVLPSAGNPRGDLVGFAAPDAGGTSGNQVAVAVDWAGRRRGQVAVFDRQADDGAQPLSPWHTTKNNGRRYRCYVPQRDAKEHAGASGLSRLPAAELESAVLDQLRAILRAPNLLGDMLPQAIKLDPTLDEAKITVAMTRLDGIWDQLFPAEQTRIVKLLVEKVIVSPNDLEVRLHANGIDRLVLELLPSRSSNKRRRWHERHPHPENRRAGHR